MHEHLEFVAITTGDELAHLRRCEYNIFNVQLPFFSQECSSIAFTTPGKTSGPARSRTSPGQGQHGATHLSLCWMRRHFQMRLLVPEPGGCRQLHGKGGETASRTPVAMSSIQRMRLKINVGTYLPIKQWVIFVLFKLSLSIVMS